MLRLSHEDWRILSSIADSQTFPSDSDPSKSSQFAMFAQVKYSKYHALGNDYLVITPQDLAFELTPEKIERICHRNFGIGSDGILFGPLPSNEARFGLRIFNPDGSEAEKSGNGLRIFSRYL